MAESEVKLGERLIDRKTGTEESLLVRLPWVVKHVKHFDYVVVNADGKLESAVKLVESIIDAEKAKVWRRKTFYCEMGFFLRKVLLLVIEKEQQNHTIPTLFETPAFSMQ
uniref:Uncharacterized protein n=1 Tax=Cucumis melo TaxID=3656 RepID=A0A9I9E4F5_CUCME